MSARSAHETDENSLATVQQRNVYGMFLLIKDGCCVSLPLLLTFFGFFFLPESPVAPVLCDLSVETRVLNAHAGQR